MNEPTRVIIIPDTAASVRGSLRAIYQDGKSPFAAKDLQTVGSPSGMRVLWYLLQSAGRQVVLVTFLSPQTLCFLSAVTSFQCKQMYTLDRPCDTYVRNTWKTGRIWRTHLSTAYTTPKTVPRIREPGPDCRATAGHAMRQGVTLQMYRSLAILALATGPA